MKSDFTIITQKLMLKLPNANEAQAFAQLISLSPSLYQWLDWAHKDFSHQDAEDFLLANRLNWMKETSLGFGVYRLPDKKLIGMVAVTEFQRVANMASVGYWIADNYQQQGYGNEAVGALIEFCFAKINLTRLEIVCDPENVPSQIIAKKCGAIEECLAKNRYVFRGKPRSGIVFSITP